MIYVTIMKKNIIYDDDYDDNDIHVLIDDWICICMYVCFNVCMYVCTKNIYYVYHIPQ
jgi:hypothetical protein